MTEFAQVLYYQLCCIVEYIGGATQSCAAALSGGARDCFAIFMFFKCSKLSKKQKMQHADCTNSFVFKINVSYAS